MEWRDITQIRDTVHGYVLIPKPIVQELIDLPEFQRLKDIQQTGMDALYPAATHDRFTHSLGVYHLGCRAFKAFRENMRTTISIQKCTPAENESKEGSESEGNGSTDYYALIGEEKWIRWELLFQLACLLHDCGHAPFSHTLEFIYDLQDNQKNASAQAFSTRGLIQFFSHDGYSLLENDIHNESGGVFGAPHERMSAYFITQNPFVDAVKKLIRDWLDNNHIADNKATDDFLYDDIEFICRMIIGCPYRYEKAEQYQWNCNISHTVPENVLLKREGEAEGLSRWKFELQMRNCVIHMLNSALDVDNLDYTVRDAKISGYESQEIDIERLLSAFTVVSGIEFDGKQTINISELNCPAIIQSFSGKISLNISGACQMRTLDSANSIVVRGKLGLHGETFADKVGEKERHCFFTTDEFSARVEGETVELYPTGNAPCARLYLSGSSPSGSAVMSGKLKGVIYSNKLPSGYGEERFEFAFRKSCLSVLQSAVQARNYEYLWIYAHHTTSFQNDYLLIYLLDRYAGYLLNQGVLPGYDDILRTVKYLGSCITKCKCNGLEEFDEKKILDEQFAKAIMSIKQKKNGRIILQYLLLNNSSNLEIAKSPFTEVRNFRELLMEKASTSISKDAFSVAEELQHVVNCCFQACILSSDRFEPEQVPDNLAARLKELTVQCGEVLSLLSGKIQLTDEAKDCLKNLSDKAEHLRGRDMMLMQDLLAFTEPKEIQGTCLFRSTDHDLLSMYKSLYRKMCMDNNVKESNKDLYNALEQYFSRNYPACAWKTHPEYLYFFRDWTMEEIKYFQDKLRTFSIPNAIYQERLYTDTSRAEGEGLAQVDMRANICVLDEEQVTHLEEKHQYVFCRLLWDVLKKPEYGIKRCTWITKKVPIKCLPLDTTMIRMGDSVLRLKDIGLFSNETANRGMIYLFYEKKTDGGEVRLNAQNISNLLKDLRGIVQNEMKKEFQMRSMPFYREAERRTHPGDMVIRDVIHGDIRLPQTFARLVEAKEFQRLRRIKQLATADLIFPDAVHTRFAHSLGTYCVMQKVVSHFRQLFRELDLDVDPMDWNAVLAAALLHDIGHGPFSHAFEVLDIGKNHEEWGKTILQDESTEINRALMDFYPDDQGAGHEFLKRVCDYLHAQYHSNKVSKDNSPLFGVFAALVSSQLDADRMDYLLRDAYHAGLEFGKVDVDNLIEGLTLTVGEDRKYNLCVQEEFVPFVESYIIARFQMYRNIYNRPYKLFTEHLLVKILQRARRLCVDGSQPLRRFTSEAILNLFDKNYITANYIALDDSVVIDAVQQWRSCEEDTVLAALCDTLLERGHFLRCSLLDGEDQDLKSYKQDLQDRLSKIHFKKSLDNIEDCGGVIIIDKSYQLYTKKEWPIQVHCSNGEIRDLTEVSTLITGAAGKREYVRIVYINPLILGECYDAPENEREKLEKTVMQLNSAYENRNHIEIEQKFTVSSPEDLQRLIQLIQTSDELGGNYLIDPREQRLQVDQYFDAECEDGDFKLKCLGVTVRIRHYLEPEERYKLTVKLPTQTNRSARGQSSRFEFEFPCNSANLTPESIELIWKTLQRRLPGFLCGEEPPQLVPILSIKNKRDRFRVRKKGAENGFCCEISCDDLCYTSLVFPNLNNVTDRQVEIELKSDFKYRVNLDLFSKQLVKCAGNVDIQLIEEDLSKFQKAMIKNRELLENG